MTKLTALALFALAPLGALIAVSDGAPRPPDRFKNKLREWERRNFQGRFVEINPGSTDPKHTWSRDSFAIRTTPDDGFLVVNAIHDVGSSLTYEVISPAPVGAILMLSERDFQPGYVHASHVFADDAAAYGWASRKHYSLLEQTKYGSYYERVKEDGSREPWTPAS